MRKLVLGLALMLTATASAQKVYQENQDFFTLYESKKDKSSIKYVEEGESKYILNFEGKTALELFQATEVMVGTIWKNPDEVIVGLSEGKYIKINGGAPSIKESVLFSPVFYDSKVSLTFNFKDGRMLMTISSYTYTVPGNQYNGYVSTELNTSVKMTKRSGKKYKYAEQTVNSFNIFMNNIVYEIKKQVKNQSSSSTSDW